MSGEPTSERLADRMRGARIRAEHVMQVFEDQGEVWEEPTVTDLLLATVHPLVRWARFTRREEGEWTGADWMWWWVDSKTDEAFGALVQAKRLKRVRGRWHIDFNYRQGDQRRRLMDTADFLQVLPMYALYLGTEGFRAGSFCQAPQHSPGCPWCREATLSGVPAVLTHFPPDPIRDVETAMRFSHSMERLVDPSTQPPRVWDSRTSRFPKDLAAFLDEPQTGSRAIAKKIVNKLQERRSGQYSASTAPLVNARHDEAVFAEVPDDHGHGGPSTYAYPLRSLLRHPPQYVRDFLDGGRADPMGEWSETLRWANVSGLAVFTV